MANSLHGYIVCLATCVLVGCRNTTVEDSIRLSTNVLQLAVGESQMLTAAATTDVIWQSEDVSVARVDDGLVTATGIGKTLITATAGKAQAVCQVYAVSARGITLALPKAYMQVDKGTTQPMEVISMYDVPLTWTSTDSAVAIVDNKGWLHALHPGHTTITVSNGAESASCYLAVRHKWGEYELVWADEFNGSELERTSWNVEINGNGGGNNELQYYTDRADNLRVEDGCLIIEARKENYAGRRYTSARINTMGKRTFLYGKIEARILFPSGEGTWPAFWMMGNDYSRVGWPSCGETDIVEHIGNDPRLVSHALHYPYKSGGNCWSTRQYHDGVENEFHTYGIEWMQEEEYGRDMIRFMFDGQVHATQSETLENIDDEYYWPFNKENFLLLNLAIGGSMGGNVNDAMFDHPVQMKVDWVRVYQRKEIE